MKAITILAGVALLVTVSCKKHADRTTTPCAATIYAYSRAGDSATQGPYIASSFGIFNPTMGTSATLANIRTTSFNNQGAYNTANNCYYVFSDSAKRPILYKITESDAVSVYRLPTSATCTFAALVFNGFTNKLMAIKQDAVDTLVEITTDSTATFTTHDVATFVNDNVRPMSMTVNPSTGTVYAAVNNTIASPISYKIMKLASGSTSFVVTDSVSSRWLFGLEYNTSDNMLYGVTTGNYLVATLSTFVKINPTGGITNLGNLSFVMHYDYFSSCLDACNGKYVLSTYPSTPSNGFDSSNIYQLDMSGNLLQSNHVAGIYNGLDVKN